MTTKNIWDCELLSKPNDYIYLFNVNKHEKLKNKLLKNINNTPFTNINNVSKTDWEIDHFLERKYWDKNMVNIFESCTSLLKKDLYKNIEFKTILKNYWFHIYKKNSGFKWHTHGSNNFSGIYYICIPSQKYKTEFLNIDISLQEGNLIIFPSFLAHRSPVNKLTKQKVVLSFNFSMEE